MQFAIGDRVICTNINSSKAGDPCIGKTGVVHDIRDRHNVLWPYYVKLDNPTPGDSKHVYLKGSELEHVNSQLELDL